MTDVARRLFSLSRLFKPRATISPISGADRLFLQWLCFVGLLLFASFLMWRANIWGVLVAADPTGITLMIIAVFAGSTLWVGMRAWSLMHERQALDAWKLAAISYAPSTPPENSETAVHAYFSALLGKSRRHDYDNVQLTDVLAERLARFDIHPSAPLWGEGELRSTEAARELELAALDDEESKALRAGLEDARLKQERRALRLRPALLQHQWLADDVLELSFALPPGCYATAVLHELGPVEDASQA